MNKQEFKIWKIQNGYTNETLAERLQITVATIVNRTNKTRLSEEFILTLRMLAILRNEEKK